MCLLQLDDAGHIKNSEIAKELSLPPVKLHCSSKYRTAAMYFTFSDSVSDYSITNKISQELKNIDLWECLFVGSVIHVTKNCTIAVEQMNIRELSTQQ